MSTASRNGVRYPKLIGSVPYRSPAGTAYRLEHWAILEAIRRWYVLGPGGLYAADGGFVARTIAAAAGCADAERAKELAGVLEAAYAAQGRPAPVPAAPAPSLVFRPYPGERFEIVQHVARPGAPWGVRTGIRALRRDELGQPARPGDCCLTSPAEAEFPDPASAQDAVLAMLAAGRRAGMAARLREWADRLERGEVAARAVPGAAGVAWSVEFRETPGGARP